MTKEELVEIKVNLFEAYYACRRSKRNTNNAIAFELNYEQELFRLYEDIISYTYEPGRSIAFLVQKPVMREIFAATFRDRVVHHYLINQLNPIFERHFIYDSYSCRVGKGTLFGIERMEKFMRACSDNYTNDCYVLKLDISGYFMHINRVLLFVKVLRIVNRHYHAPDKPIIIYLLAKIIFQNPLDDCDIRGLAKEWDKLPRTKSLFYMPKGVGLPIGNLTSQVFSNIYLNDFDHFVKRDLKAHYYGRYVDDFVLMHRSKAQLIEWREQIRTYLKEHLNLDVHPKKEYLQHYGKGMPFLGGILKPHRRYVGPRALKSFNQLMHATGWIADYDFLSGTGDEKRHEQIVSYVGFMKHFKAHKQIAKYQLS
ncbi:MAG: reverse transcriptase/maturase family protein [Candidatus Symbiothrix sp.]|jgi:retron-type reverse transcriptase|nr:reverse transcriptase/maturase family protein [Candidatus Symbiothrix sp.]